MNLSLRRCICGRSVDRGGLARSQLSRVWHLATFSPPQELNLILKEKTGEGEKAPEGRKEVTEWDKGQGFTARFKIRVVSRVVHLLASSTQGVKTPSLDTL